MGKQSNQAAQGNRSAREQAAAARIAAQAAEKRRQRTINLIIAVVIGLVVLLIVGGAVYMSNQTKQESGAVADPQAVAPEGAYPSGDPLAYGIPYGTNTEAPVVEVWEDPQCPGCKAFEAAAGEDLHQRADNGEILLVTRVTTFLDRNLGTDHSRRAAAAYGCSVDAGKGNEYKSTIYLNQPEQEGTGWTDDQLIGFADTVGISGEARTTFEQCFTDRVYLPWVTNSTEAFYSAAISGTPTVLINGTKVDTAKVVDPVELQKLIDEAAAAQ